jgi:hypothetical protein
MSQARTDDERLHLYRRQCAVLAASTVVRSGTLFGFDMGRPLTRTVSHPT